MSDYFKVFWYSIVSFIIFGLNPRTNSWILQIYTAPKWFLVRIALGKLQSDFVTTDHFDRWSTLLDRICYSNNKNLTLIQHGSLKAILRPEYSHFSIYSKLHTVSCLITYDAIEKEIFMNKVIRCNKGKKIKFYHTGLGLNLAKTHSDKYSILFVGHPQCEFTQSKIIFEIRQHFGDDITIYYKEHPKAKASLHMKLLDWEFITNNKFYPTVDLVISYASTLGYQYEEVGTKVFFHDLSDYSNTFCNNIVKYIKESLKNDR